VPRAVKSVRVERRTAIAASSPPCLHPALPRLACLVLLDVSMQLTAGTPLQVVIATKSEVVTWLGHLPSEGAPG
jgi:hypothetical protein